MKKLSIFMLLLSLLGLNACKKYNETAYLDSYSVPSLKIPASLPPVAINHKYAIPAGAAGSSHQAPPSLVPPGSILEHPNLTTQQPQHKRKTLRKLA